MRKEFILYLIDRPVLTISLIFSSIPLWFSIFYAIYKEYDIVVTLLGISIIFLSKIHIYSEQSGVNPFMVALNTFIKIVTGFVFQIVGILFLIIFSISLAIGEENIAMAVGILLIVVFIVMFLSLNGGVLAKLWGIRVLDERRGVLTSIFYNLMWILIFFNDDPIMFFIGLIISISININLFFKRGLVTV